MPTKRQWAGPKRQDEAIFPADMSNVDRRSIIRVLLKDNPKVESSRSRERFALYRNGMTVADYVAAVVNAGDKEQVAFDDLAWDQNRSFIWIEAPNSPQVWSVADAKAKLSEILRLARAGEPQIIGNDDPCVVISASEFEELRQPQHLGRFLLETAPRGAELELPPRESDRGDPFADF
jgi:prevent-host-death family protein